MEETLEDIQAQLLELNKKETKESSDRVEMIIKEILKHLQDRNGESEMKQEIFTACSRLMHILDNNMLSLHSAHQKMKKWKAPKIRKEEYYTKVNDIIQQVECDLYVLTHKDKES